MKSPSRLSRRRALRLVAQAVMASGLAACSLTETAPPTRLVPTPTAVPTATAPHRRPRASGPTVGVTPIADFFSVAVTQRTNWLKPETYALTISGAVERPLALSLADLRSLPAVEQMQTLECIGNPVGGDMIGNAIWTGVRLADVLRLAGLTSLAVEIKMRGADGYSTSVPVSLATHLASLLVYTMNGEPLPDKHGAPLRALFPGRYGQKQPKWITSIEAITEPYLGHWERQGWSNDAIIRVNSRIDTPEERELISDPVYPVSGIVFSDEAGVAAVEVSTDGGTTWHQARLLRGPTPLAWSEWRYDWMTPSTGETTIIVRATDNHGNRQPLAVERTTAPDFALEGEWRAHRVSITISR